MIIAEGGMWHKELILCEPFLLCVWNSSKWHRDWEDCSRVQIAYLPGIPKDFEKTLLLDHYIVEFPGHEKPGCFRGSKMESGNFWRSRKRVLPVIGRKRRKSEDGSVECCIETVEIAFADGHVRARPLWRRVLDDHTDHTDRTYGSIIASVSCDLETAVISRRTLARVGDCRHSFYVAKLDDRQLVQYLKISGLPKNTVWTFPIFVDGELFFSNSAPSDRQKTPPSWCLWKAQLPSWSNVQQDNGTTYAPTEITATKVVEFDHHLALNFATDRYLIDNANNRIVLHGRSSRKLTTQDATKVRHKIYENRSDIVEILEDEDGPVGSRAQKTFSARIFYNFELTWHHKLAF